MEDITKDRLYGIAKKLYREKEKLEDHLSRCTNELFGLEDKIILYDLTNTYFEGRMSNKGITHDWKEIVRIMNTHKRVTTTMVNSQSKTE